MTDSRSAEMDDKQKHTSNGKLEDERIKGVVKWFNVKASYGFIHRSDTDTDVFVHQSAIAKCNDDCAIRSLETGEEVEFCVVDGDKGDEASDVTGPNGTAVKGSAYARRHIRGPRMLNTRGRGRGGPSGFSSNQGYRPFNSRGRGSPMGGMRGGGPPDMSDFIDRGDRGRGLSRGRRPRAIGFGGRFNSRWAGGGRGRRGMPYNESENDNLM